MHRLAILTWVLTGCTGQLDTDGPGDPPPVTEVAVTVREAGTPLANATVIFQAPDDTVILSTTTDATGSARAALDDGGNVTVIRRNIDDPARMDVFTYVGVEPGDQLELVRPIVPPPTTPVTVTVTLPAEGTYRVLTPCGEATGTASVTLTLTGCGAETDFFVTDLAEPGSFLVHAAIAPTLDFSTQTVRQDVDTTLTATNVLVPPQTTVTLESRLVANGFELYRSAAVPTVDTQPTTVPNIGAAPADQLVVANLATAAGKTQLIAHRQPYSTGTANVDVGEHLLPFIDSASFDGTAVTWAEDGTASADYVVVALDNKAGAIRAIAAPHAGTTLRVPVLPADAGVPPFDPAATIVAPSIVKVTGGYAAARAHVFGTSFLSAAPMDGQISIASTVAGN